MDEAKISILYAEDDEFGAKLTKTILEKENFDSFSFDYYSATIKNTARIRNCIGWFRSLEGL